MATEKLPLDAVKRLRALLAEAVKSRYLIDGDLPARLRTSVTRARTALDDMTAALLTLLKEDERDDDAPTTSTRR